MIESFRSSGRHWAAPSMKEKPAASPSVHSPSCGSTQRLATASMVKLSKAAARDIEEVLDQSIIDFGVAQTERYLESLDRCLDLLSRASTYKMAQGQLVAAR